MQKTLAKIKETSNRVENSQGKLAISIFYLSQAITNYLGWMQSPRGRAYSKAHPISKKDIVQRLKNIK